MLKCLKCAILDCINSNALPTEQWRTLKTGQNGYTTRVELELRLKTAGRPGGLMSK